MSQENAAGPRRQPENVSFRGELVNALEYAWGPLIVSAGLAFAFAFADPAHEALAALADNLRLEALGLVSALLTIMLFVFVPATMYLAADLALKTERHLGPQYETVEALVLTWVGRLPLIGVTVAVMTILASDETLTIGARAYLIVMGVYAGFSALTGLAVFLGTERRQMLRMDLADPSTAPVGRRLFLRVARPVFAIHIGVLNLCLRYQRFVFVFSILALLALGIRPELAVYLGPIGTALVFCTVAAFVLAGLTRLSHRLGYGQMPLALGLAALAMASTGPAGTWAFLIIAAIYAFVTFVRPGGASAGQRIVASVLLALAIGVLLLSWQKPECDGLAGCNLIAGAHIDSEPPNVDEGFAAWNDHRTQTPASSQPVRLVAAQGGGLFTAYETAMYLAKRADLEGAPFISSLFAISGASGGSVGASVYWAVLRSGLCQRPEAPDDCHQQAARAILAQDYLSPVLAGMFTRDLVDSLLPYSAVLPGRLDRGETLETLLATRSADGTGTAEPAQLHDAPLSASWTADAGVPALFLNATDVHTGNRVILSPFSRLTAESRLSTRTAPDEDAQGQRDPSRDLSVATAAVMSARFPVVTPPARIRRDGQSWQVVDGGYYDNSGLETIHDIVTAIEPTEADPIEIIMLQVDERDCLADDDSLSRDCKARQRGDEFLPPRPTRGTLGAPLGAFTGAWTSRRQLSQERLREAWGDRIALKAVQVQPKGFNFTVSWYLGRGTFCRIEGELNNILAEGGNDLRLSRPVGCQQPETDSQPSPAQIGHDAMGGAYYAQ